MSKERYLIMKVFIECPEDKTFADVCQVADLIRATFLVNGFKSFGDIKEVSEATMEKESAELSKEIDKEKVVVLGEKSGEQLH